MLLLIVNHNAFILRPMKLSLGIVAKMTFAACQADCSLYGGPKVAH